MKIGISWFFFGQGGVGKVFLMRFFWLVMCGESFSDEFYFGQGGFSFGQGGVGRVDRGSMPGTAFHPAPQPTTGSKKNTTIDPGFQRNFWRSSKEIFAMRLLTSTGWLSRCMKIIRGDFSEQWHL